MLKAVVRQLARDVVDPAKGVKVLWDHIVKLACARCVVGRVEPRNGIEAVQFVGVAYVVVKGGGRGTRAKGDRIEVEAVDLCGVGVELVVVLAGDGQW